MLPGETSIMKTIFGWSLAVLVWCAVPLQVHALSFDQVYVFGDSLSDQGNDYALTAGAVPPSEYSDGSVFGRFTNGRNYIDYLAQELGVSIAPSLLGGSNYAYGGARTGYRAPTSPFASSLLEQRDAFAASLGGGPADGGALYIVWAGSNNLADVVGRIVADPLYDPTAHLTATVMDLGNVVSSLAALGARDIVVPNIPDLGLVPAITGGGGPDPLVSGLVAGFNGALDGVLDQILLAFPGLQMTRLDTFGLLDQVYADPGAYGLSNVTDPCYSLYVMPGGTACGAPDQYLFWDLEHPSTATHRIFASGLIAAVPEPGVLYLMAIGLLFGGFVSRRALRGVGENAGRGISCAS